MCDNWYYGAGDSASGIYYPGSALLPELISTVTPDAKTLTFVTTLPGSGIVVCNITSSVRYRFAAVWPPLRALRACCPTFTRSDLTIQVTSGTLFGVSAASKSTGNATAAAKGGNCFPAQALVHTATGPKSLQELALGEQVGSVPYVQLEAIHVTMVYAKL